MSSLGVDAHFATGDNHQQNNETAQPAQEYVPIHEQQLPVNPQKASPLYNGRIPPEIRDTIFSFALTEDTISPFEPNTLYARPGYTGKKKVNTALLQTCRRVFLETYHLPAFNKEHVFFHAHDTGPYHAYYDDRFSFAQETELFVDSMQPWQLESVKAIHLFTQSFWLEQVFPQLCKEKFMQGIEKVKMTVRRCDWWWNERNHPLAINAPRGNGDTQQMTQDILTAKAGGVVPWNMEGWGGAFAHLSSLKELEIELETSDDKKDELVAIVDWAKDWKFPLGDGKVLSTDGVRPKDVWTWNGPLRFSSEQCPYCYRYSRCREVNPPNEKCTERMRLKDLGVGPLCHVFSLRWKVAEDTSISTSA